MIDRVDDTIVAVSTAPGSGVRGIVRLSGPQAIELVSRGFRADDGADLQETAGWTRTRGQYVIDAEVVVPACVQLFREPHSYTRQDMAEIHTIGSPPVLSKLVRSLLAGGARAAEPGEFTARAFFTGAMDLTEVEGVAAVIRARSDGQLRAAEKLLHGNLSKQLGGIRDRLVDLLALIEADIDFSEEPIELIAPEETRRRLEGIRRGLADMAEHAGDARRMDLLPTVLLAGPPNAGKSTLLNRLSGLQRAICSPLAGTTRDVLTAPMRLEAGEILLIDAAGLGLLRDDIDRRAAEALERAWRQADVIVLVLDASVPVPPEVVHHVAGAPQPPSLIVANKRDLVSSKEFSKIFFGLERTFSRPVIGVSATVGTGCERLKEWLSKKIFSTVHPAAENVLILNHRHRHSLQQCLGAIARARALADPRDAIDVHAEVIAFELREALEALQLLTGETTNEEILGRIFDQFCIGK